MHCLATTTRGRLCSASRSSPVREGLGAARGGSGQREQCTGGVRSVPKPRTPGAQRRNATRLHRLHPTGAALAACAAPQIASWCDRPLQNHQGVDERVSPGPGGFKAFRRPLGTPGGAWIRSRLQQELEDISLPAQMHATQSPGLVEAGVEETQPSGAASASARNYRAPSQPTRLGSCCCGSPCCQPPPPRDPPRRQLGEKSGGNACCGTSESRGPELDLTARLRPCRTSCSARRRGRRSRLRRALDSSVRRMGWFALRGKSALVIQLTAAAHAADACPSLWAPVWRPFLAKGDANGRSR